MLVTAFDGVVGAVGVDEAAEVLEGEPGHPPSGLHDELAEGFEQERLAGAGGGADHQVLAAVHPFQGA